VRRLLLVDDELEISQLAAEYLAASGWKSDPVTTLAQAERLVDAGGPYDAAVIDWVIGGSTARGLLERVHLRQPTCRVLLASGHGVDILRDNPQGVPVIRKPYTLRALAARLDALAPVGTER
jgi:DNA-binding response OmpR family regulator